MAKKGSSSWMQSIKKQGITPSTLSFEELKAFKWVDEYLFEPIDGSAEWQYFERSFRMLTAFAAMLYSEKSYPAFTACWDELHELFGDDPNFGDGRVMHGWMYCNFPFGKKNKTVVDYFEESLEGYSESIESLQHFIEQLRASRLGLYQIIMIGKKNIKCKELFTDEMVLLDRDRDTAVQAGEISLMRIVTIGKKTFPVGDFTSWPKEYKEYLINMVSAKLFYFDEPTIKEQYLKFMRFAGPYWMSCIVTDDACPVLDPDHYLSYLLYD